MRDCELKEWQKDIYNEHGNILFVVWCIFALFHFAFVDFEIRTLYGIIILAFFLVYSYFYDKKICINDLKGWYMLLTVSLILEIWLNNRRMDFDTLFYSCMLLLSMFYVLQTYISKKEIDLVGKLVCIFSIGLFFYMLLCKISPSFFWNYIFPQLREGTKIWAFLNFNSNGYGVPIGGSVTFPAYILFIRCLFVYGKYFSVNHLKFVYKLEILMLWGGVLLCGRRGELLAYCLTSLILFCVYHRLKVHLTFSNVFIAMLMIVCGVFMYDIGIFGRLLQTVNNYNIGRDVTSGRMFLYETAWNVFLDNSFFGVGWGGFAEYVPSNFVNPLRINNVRSVHCFILQLLCETGLFGTLLIMFPICLFLLFALKQSLRIQKQKLTLLYRENAIALGWLIFMFIVCSIDSTFYWGSMWIYYPIAIMLLIYVYREESRF